MQRIIDVTKIILSEDQILCKIHTLSNLIITPESNQEVAFDYLEIIAVGKKVDDYSVGDIVLDLVIPSSYGFKIGTQGYIKFPRHGIKLAVKADNFDKNKNKKTNLLN